MAFASQSLHLITYDLYTYIIGEAVTTHPPPPLATNYLITYPFPGARNKRREKLSNFYHSYI